MKAHIIDERIIELNSLFPGAFCLLSKDDESFLYVNDQLVELAGYGSPEEMMKRNPGFRDIVLPEDYHPLEEVFSRNEIDAVTRTKQLHFRMKRSDDTLLLMDGVMKAYRLQSGHNIWMVYLIPIHAASDRDPVTGLMGPETFYKEARKVRISDSLTEINTFHTSIYFNISNFKLYNTCHGREAGDLLLKKMASLLRTYFPTALITRLTADNFAMLSMKNDPKEAIECVSYQLKAYIGDPSIVLKAGIVYPTREITDTSMNNISHYTDLAHLACESIRNDASRTWAVYDDSMGNRVNNRNFVMSNFENALEKGHIMPYFQPVVHTSDGKLCSAEVLARWIDPDRGMISPASFIPFLEEARMIPRLDYHIVRETAKILKERLEKKQSVIPCSVNFSRVDFDMGDPFLFMEGIIRKFNLPRYLFHIEITESALTQDDELLRHQIDRFREAGYEVWLDDFGSGYSSLHVLQNFNFDEIKIDMAFQRTKTEKSRALLSSIIALAKNMGLHTLAEGVETKEQADFLKSIGCEKIQGYYYGKPMDKETFLTHCTEKGLYRLAE